MPSLYHRHESKQSIVIAYPYYALYYLFLIITLILSLIIPFGRYLLGFLVMITILQVLAYRKPNKEIKAALKAQKVKISGSKWSLKDPLTFEIER